ncbi:unnamed protein product [Musa banksii]
MRLSSSTATSTCPCSRHAASPTWTCSPSTSAAALPHAALSSLVATPTPPPTTAAAATARRSPPPTPASPPGATVARTRVIHNSQNPIWNERFKIPVAHSAAALVLHVKDNDVFGSQLIGTVSIPVARVASGEVIDEWFPVIAPSGRTPKPDTALRVSLQYTPVEESVEHRHGIAGDPDKRGVSDAYFPVRKGCLVTLYQDAHVRDGELPEIRLEEGAIFEHNKCWEDICHAILEAHHLIYITGWSIYHKVKLVREPTRPLPTAGQLTLGELLKYKSQEGVRVCMLVWDDKTSHHNFFIKTEGVMQTHDEETQEVFQAFLCHLCSSTSLCEQ